MPLYIMVMVGSPCYMKLFVPSGMCYFVSGLNDKGPYLHKRYNC